MMILGTVEACFWLFSGIPCRNYFTDPTPLDPDPVTPAPVTPLSTPENKKGEVGGGGAGGRTADGRSSKNAHAPLRFFFGCGRMTIVLIPIIHRRFDLGHSATSFRREAFAPTDASLLFEKPEIFEREKKGGSGDFSKKGTKSLGSRGKVWYKWNGSYIRPLKDRVSKRTDGRKDCPFCV